MNKEIEMTHTLKILLAVLMTTVFLSAGFIGWLYYSGVLGTKTAAVTTQTPVKRASTNQTELTNIQNEIQNADDIDINDLDNTSELDSIDLSGI